MVCSLFLILGCARDNQYPDLRPITLEAAAQRDQQSTSQPRPLLGFAFGGGGVRGFVHLGVLRALDEAGIRPDVVSGTSVGAIAAALYASGVPYQTIEERVLALDEADLLDVVLSREGFVNGQALAAWIREVTGHTQVQSLPIPLAIMVTDLDRSLPLMIREGDLGHAVQASASVPGTVLPVHAPDATLIDGGILSVVPVRAARALGADVVVGVDIYCGPPGPLKHHALDTLLRTVRMQSCLISKAEMAEADILIQPPHEPDIPLHFGQRKAAIESGYRATQRWLPALRRSLENHPGNTTSP